MGLSRDSYTRSKVLIHEITKFGIVGILAVPITVGGADALRYGAHLGVLSSVAISIILATIFTFLGNKYWTFKHRKGNHLYREPVLFFLFNGVGLLIQLAFVWAARYGLALTDTFSYNLANITGIIAATFFRLYTYRRWVFLSVAEPAARTARAGSLQDLSLSIGHGDRLLRQANKRHEFPELRVSPRRQAPHVKGSAMAARSATCCLREQENLTADESNGVLGATC